MCLRCAKIPEALHKKQTIEDWQVGFYEIKNSSSKMGTVTESGKISQWLDQGNWLTRIRQKTCLQNNESYSIHNQSKGLNGSINKKNIKNLSENWKNTQNYFLTEDTQMTKKERGEEKMLQLLYYLGNAN